MNDFMGSKLEVGDTIAYIYHSRTSSELRKGIVSGFTACYVKVGANGQLVSPLKVTKEVTQ